MAELAVAEVGLAGVVGEIATVVVLNTLPETDRVLDRLQTLPNLKMLHINATPATAARVTAFRKAKPNYQVDWSEKK